VAHGHAFSQALHASASMPNLRARGPASARAMAVTDRTPAPDDAGGMTVVLRMPPFAGGRPSARERDGSVCGSNQLQRRRGTEVAQGVPVHAQCLGCPCILCVCLLSPRSIEYIPLPHLVRFG
jgi:hypothetical protein